MEWFDRKLFLPLDLSLIYIKKTSFFVTDISLSELIFPLEPFLNLIVQKKTTKSFFGLYQHGCSHLKSVNEDKALQILNLVYVFFKLLLPLLGLKHRTGLCLGRN